jgi:hypothetical protein
MLINLRRSCDHAIVRAKALIVAQGFVRWSSGPHSVLAGRGRNDERFSVMYRQRVEAIIQAFDERLATLHQVEHVHTSTRVVRYRHGEPMTTGLDEFPLVKASTLFVPPVNPLPLFARD